MKTKHIFLSILSLFVWTFLFAQTKKDTVKVWGNCGMCEKTIENAAKSAGATEADWNKDTKVLNVSYAANKTNLVKIEQAVAAAGYDTKNFTASEDAYIKLEPCCQYDRKTATTKDLSTASQMDDCCKDGKTDKCEPSKDGKTADCCKDGKCSDCAKDGKCVKNKDGKTADCCKDGKCSSAGDCCKKS
jgi:periplasmic mercuric ion binding protein